jgi:radical SAM/Cys-rich protein
MYAQELSSDTRDENNNANLNVVPFKATLAQHNLQLVRDRTHTLQINMGYLCNQVCRHCHLNAGPGRNENMDAETAAAVVAYAARSNFETIDITGGAPELNSNLPRLIEDISPHATRLMLRSNLSAMRDKLPQLMGLLQDHRVAVVASFPSVNITQTDAQRGEGFFQESVAVLKQLNKIGYGHKNSGLILDLVSNPTGAYLPPSQEQAQQRFHQVLESRWGVVFNSLFSFANVPLGRFRDWLIKTNNFNSYMTKLSASFNPCAVEGLMCRSLVSVSWDGYLYDCDFNLARGLPMCGRKIHVSEMKDPPDQGSLIATADHCYTCTAGSGFT